MVQGKMMLVGRSFDESRSKHGGFLGLWDFVSLVCFGQAVQTGGWAYERKVVRAEVTDG